ncbi:uncharacterized protein [Elaeis guineensis]|uniref:uncharacterized protein n=1 Tax=Elaeis guineensis var. tenera TaxID=51953 RepID=UPI003C6D093D
MYSNVVELFNNWAKEAQQLLITPMVDMLRYKMMELMHERRDHSHKWQTYLVSKIEELINMNIEDGRGLTVQYSNGEWYWQVSGHPCSHACVTIIRKHESVYTYVSEFFTVDAYRRMYEHAIFPIADISKPTSVKREDLIIKPSITKLKAGRPKKKHIESQPEEVHPLKCGRCYNVEYNRKTCNAPIAEE